MIYMTPEILITTTAFVCVIIIIALLANAAVLLAFMRSKQLQQPTNYFAVNLAATDIFIILGPLALWMVIMWHNYNAFIFKKSFVISPQAIPYFYKFWTFIDSTLLNVSVTNLAFLSLERYFAVTAPIRHRISLTPRKMRFVCLGTWLISLLIMSPSFAFDAFSLQRYFQKALPVLICCLIVIVSYIALLRKVFIKGCLDSHLGVGQRKKIRREVILSIRLSLLTATFLVCWAPITIFSFWAASKNNHERLLTHYFVVMPILKLLSYSHSFLNPFLYVFGRPAFATVIRRIFTCKKVLAMDVALSNSHASRRVSNLTEVGNETRL